MDTVLGPVTLAFYDLWLMPLNPRAQALLRNLSTPPRGGVKAY